MVNNQIEELQNQFAEGFEEGVVDVEEKDLIIVDLAELDKKKIKEDGYKKENTHILVRDIIDKKIKKEILSAKVGDTIDIKNIFKLEDKDENHVRKYILGIEDESVEVGSSYQITIKEIRRTKKAELNADFFKKVFPSDEISENEDFVNKVRGAIEESYKNVSLQQFQKDANKNLLELNQFELPESFLNKYFTTARNLDENYIKENFNDIKENVRWSIIRDKLAQKYDIKVSKEDIENVIRGNILQYVNYQLPPYSEVVNNLVEKTMNDPQERQKHYENLFSNLVMEKVSEDIGKDVKSVSKEDFDQIINPKKEDSVEK